MNLGHGFRVQHIQNHVGGLLQFVVSLSRLHFLYQDNILLVNRCNKIFGLAGKQAPYGL